MHITCDLCIYKIQFFRWSRTMFKKYNKEEKGACLELAYCKSSNKSDIKEIVSISNIPFSQPDSLYVAFPFIKDFIEQYDDIFTGGTYHNLKSGPVDVCGLNYYNPDLTNQIINKIKEQKPQEFEVVLNWLEETKQYNGFYILGF